MKDNLNEGDKRKREFLRKLLTAQNINDLLKNY